MRNYIRTTLGIAAATIALATSAQAQGKGHGHDRDKHDDRNDRDRAVVVHRANGDVLLVPHNRDAIPPGLAKKPGQMPPGQFKKRYSTDQGASTLSDVFRRRGYTVERVVPSGSSRYVYYRTRDGALHHAIVSPGTDRLSFSNVPSSLLQQVLGTLY